MIFFFPYKLTSYESNGSSCAIILSNLIHSQAFVGCTYGISNIGFVMICFGVCNALAAPVAGSIVKLTGRFPVMVTALVRLPSSCRVRKRLWKSSSSN